VGGSVWFNIYQLKQALCSEAVSPGRTPRWDHGPAEMIQSKAATSANPFPMDAQPPFLQHVEALCGQAADS